MALAELTDPSAVERAMDEFERLGRDAFLQKYRYGRSCNYFVERNGTLYDSKAIVGVAYGMVHPDRGPLRPNEFSGGDATVRRKLEELGFSVHAGAPETLESFSQIMASILELQESYSSRNTPEMQLRGRLIRQDGPKALRRLVADLPAFAFPFETEGRDGTGLKTRVPWMRIFTKQFSPRATSGWYVVFLFATDGSAVYLSLNQGTTTFEDGDFRGRPSSFLQERVTGARVLLAARSDGRMLQEIGLRDPGGLGQGYEQGNVFAYRYESEALPDDEALQHDLQTMLHLLEMLYANEATSTEALILAQVLQRVLELQPSYRSDGNSTEMQLRGHLLKHDGPRALQPMLARLPELSFEPDIVGGDGTSRKARVPFILVTDGQRNAGSLLRWYVTYLFAADGSAAYLSLNLGSPRQDEGKKLELPLPFRRECVTWARSVLSLEDAGTEQ